MVIKMTGCINTKQDGKLKISSYVILKMTTNLATVFEDYMWITHLTDASNMVYSAYLVVAVAPQESSFINMELTACLGTINWSDSMHVHYSIQVIYLWYKNISINPQAQLNRYHEIKCTCRLERSLNSLRSASYIMFSRYFLFFNIVFISYMCLGLY